LQAILEAQATGQSRFGKSRCLERARHRDSAKWEAVTVRNVLKRVAV
jgi:hypothetical protein